MVVEVWGGGLVCALNWGISKMLLGSVWMFSMAWPTFMSEIGLGSNFVVGNKLLRTAFHISLF